MVVTVQAGRKVSGPFNYDTSMGKPCSRLSAAVGTKSRSATRRKLVGSLPEQVVAEFAFFTYGDANSRCVAIAVTRLQPHRLFADLDRNRLFDAGEEIHRKAGDSADHWQLDLDAEFVVGSNQFEHARRRAEIRVNPTTGKLEFATLGCMRGNVALENRTVEVLRTDGNGNGLWFDADDRFWIDVNGNARLIHFARSSPVAPRVP